MVTTDQVNDSTMAVKTQNGTALLRRPLPPKVLSPVADSQGQYRGTRHRSFKTETRQNKEGVTVSKAHETTTRDKHVCDLGTTADSFEPRGPDPLPTRKPRRVEENPYEAFVDGRFAPSSPLFTLKDFLKSWDASEVTEQATGARKMLGRSKERQAYYESARQVEVYKKVIDADSAELPKRSTRKPQRQIIIELAAAILSNEGAKLEEEITRILEEVEVSMSQQPTRFLLGSSRPPSRSLQDFCSTSETLQEWSDISSLGINDMSYISHVLAQNVHRKQTDVESTAVTEVWNGKRVTMSKGETFPQSEVVLSRSPSAYFQGQARCSSPFHNDEREHETMLAAEEFVVLETIVRGYTTLDLKAHFIEQLPNIEPLSLKLTVVNLSFNNFRIFPPEIFVLKNLVSLNLRDNPIREIPLDIGQLFRLQTFVISFCLVSSLPLSLFSLKHLKLLDLSYNRLSFIPNEIGNMRSLVEFSVEGNELGALPTGIIKLRLKHLRIMNNFTHFLFWKETTSSQPQRLFHMVAQTVVENSLVVSTLPNEIQAQLLKSQTCDCCDGPVFGPGVRIIKTIEELFGVVTIPFIFTVCSQTCRKAFKKNPEAVNNWLEMNCPTSVLLKKE